MSTNLSASQTKDPSGTSSPIVFLCYTRDISSTGLSLVLPSISCETWESLAGNLTMHIMLDLPSEPVRLMAEAIRCEQLDENDTGKGSCLGVRIKNCGGRDEEHFRAYLSPLR